MLPFIASLALLQAQDQPPRLRTVLDNDSIVFVEPMPRERAISVQLFASSKYIPETAATHGYRHLLEHLLATGDKGLDRKLESQGCFLRASTLRDAMQIEITVGPSQLGLALETITRILRRPEIAQKRIDDEMRVMREELALEEDPLRLASAAWEAAFGEAGLDPLGTFDSMYRATPEKLVEVFDRQFAADGLVLSIAGPVDLDKATSMAKLVLAPLPKSRLKVPALIREGKPGRGSSDGFGECRGAIVGNYNSPQTAAALAGALAIASELSDCFVIYTPTTQAGLVMVGRTESNSGVGLYIDGLSSGAGLYRRGRLLAQEWVKSQLRTAGGVAYLRGLLLCQGAGNRPESLLNQIDAMTPSEFDIGLKSFASGRAAISVGTR